MASEKDIIKERISEESVTLIDFRRIGFFAIRYWYLVLFSLSIALAIAFYKNRYTIRVYPVVSSIIIREKEETSGADFVYKNALVDQYRNYLNEPYILRSLPLLREVIEDGDFDVSFYQEGYVKTSELYNVLPVKADLLRVGPVIPGRFTLSLSGTDRIRVESMTGQEKTVVEVRVGETAKVGQNVLVFTPVPDVSFEAHTNRSYQMIIKDPGLLATEYAGKLTINWAEEGAGVLNLRINSQTPAREIDFINGLIRRYQLGDLNKKNMTANMTVVFIQSQLKKISDSLRIFEGQLQRFKNENRSAGNLDEEGKRIVNRLETLESQKAEYLMRQQYYDYLTNYLAEGKNLDQIVLPSFLGINDPVLSGLISKMTDLQLELKLFADREKSSNPLVAAKLSRLSEIKRELISAVQGIGSTEKIRVKYLDAQITSAERFLSYLPLAERQLVSIKRNYSLLENLYVFLMQKMSEAEISKASSSSDIIIVNPPLIGGGSITPKVSQNYTYAVVAGLGLPFLIFLLIEIFNNRIQSKQDIDKITSVPFIGGIGHKKSINNLEVLSAPKSSIAESFRALRSNLNYFLDPTIRPIIMVSSSISGEGKTFTSINLASIFALSGKKTLLVGADMRKPKIYQDLQLTNDHGLSTYLSGMDTFDDIIQVAHNASLHLASAGPVPPNPSELLLSPRLLEFFREARLRYEYIIIDTPPMAIVTDAFVLSPLADHTLFIVRQNYTPKSLVKTTNDFYTSGKIKNMSIVLNDIYKSGLGYGYGYGYTYDYYTYGYGRRKNGYGYYTEE